MPNKLNVDRPCVVITGTPVYGFEIFGPFPIYDEAVAYGERNGEADWWVVNLQSVEEQEPEPLGFEDSMALKYPIIQEDC